MINPRTFYDRNGRESGYQCYTCGRVFQSMWGNKCNGCREQQRQHEEMLEAIKKLQTLTPPPDKNA